MSESGRLRPKDSTRSLRSKIAFIIRGSRKAAIAVVDDACGKNTFLVSAWPIRSPIRRAKTAISTGVVTMQVRPRLGDGGCSNL
jgi:hypothetical protein